MLLGTEGSLGWECPQLRSRRDFPTVAPSLSRMRTSGGARGSTHRRRTDRAKEAACARWVRARGRLGSALPRAGKRLGSVDLQLVDQLALAGRVEAVGDQLQVLLRDRDLHVSR